MLDRSFLRLRLVAFALALTACSTARPAPSPAPSIASPSPPATDETADAGVVVTLDRAPADASSPRKRGPFKRIRAAAVEARAITVIDEDRIYRFEGSSRTPARSVAYHGVASIAGAEIEIATDHDVRYLETSTLREKGPPCAFGEGSVRVTAAHGFVLLAKDDKATFVMNTHTCKRTNASALAATIKASSIGEDGVLLSTTGTRLGVLEGFCDKMAIYDITSGAKLRTDTGAKRAASAKGCDAVDLGDDGKVTWVPRGVCAVGGPMTFIDARTAIVGGADHLAIVRGYKKVECGNGVEDGPIEEIGRVPLENTDGYVEIAHADANGAVVTSETHVFVITLAPTKPVGKAPSRIVATEIRELQPR